MTDINNDVSAELYFRDMNKRLGGALIPLASQNSEIIGREEERHTLDTLLNRPYTHVVTLIGEPGTGKTALVESWQEAAKKSGRDIHLYSLSHGKLSANGREVLMERLDDLLVLLGEYQKILDKESPDKNPEVVLFVDELHVLIELFGNSKIGGDLLKRNLARPSVKFISATTREEYDNYILNDKALSRRFKQLEMNDISGTDLIDALAGWVNHLPKSVNIPTKIIEMIVDGNQKYRPNEIEPAASIDILESLYAVHQTDGDQVDGNLVRKVFKNQYNIDLDFQFNRHKIFNNIVRRVKGQPLAVYTMKRVVNRITHDANHGHMRNKPRAVILEIGTTGTGKTELVRALAEGAYGSETAIEMFNMTNYMSESDDKTFQRELGTRLLHNPSSIFLFDEFEKASQSVQKQMLPLFEEGYIEFETKSVDGYNTRVKASGRNAMFILTSNAGAKTLGTISKVSQVSLTQENMNEYSDELKREAQQTQLTVIEALKNAKFAPEIIGRIKNILVFRALGEAALLEIIENKLIDMKQELYNDGYNIHWRGLSDWGKNGSKNYPGITATELAMYVKYERISSDADSGGARAAVSVVNDDIYDEIIGVINDNENDDKEYTVLVSDKAMFKNKENGGVIKGNAGITVIPQPIFNLYMNGRSKPPKDIEATINEMRGIK